MSDHDHPEPERDQLPERVMADVARWRAAQPPPPDLDSQPPLADAGRRLGPRHRSRRRLPLAAVAAAAAVAVATGAVLATAPGHNGNSQAGTGIGARLVGHIQPVTLGGITPQDIARAQTAFGLDLLARRCTANSTANDVLSPASAALALAMLDTGATGSTRPALSRLLHLPDWSPQLVAALHDQHEALTRLAQLKVSNHIYSQIGVHPGKQVLNDLATAEGADLQTLDFARHAGQATDAINARVAADTDRLIPTLFDQPLDPNTTTVLTNALYLDAAWKTPFLPAHDAPFHTAAGRTVTAPLMSSVEDGQIRHVGGWTSAALPYTGGQLQAVVLLPDNSIANVAGAACAAPNSAQLAALTTGPSTDGPVEMPKLHLSQTSQLKNDLAALGLPLYGDYSGFGASGYISQVVQKTVLQVDEHGTKAVAATGIAMSLARRIGVTADRPYLLLIQDTTTGTPLFLARINDPTATAG